MPNDNTPRPHPLSATRLDPAHAALPRDEQREAWWRGTEDKEAWRSGEDVEYAYDDMFTEGLNNRTRSDENWARIAYYLAAGVTVTEVARHFALSRSTIWRALQRSPGLRRRIAAEREMLRRETDSRFVAMRHAVVEGLSRAINAGNIRAILWAAERLDLGGPFLERTECPPEPEFRPIRRPSPRQGREPATLQGDGPDDAPTALSPPEPVPAPPMDGTVLAPPSRREATRRARGPIRRLVLRLRALPRLTDQPDERLVPFPAAPEARMNPWLPREAPEELNIYRPATCPRR